MNESCRDKMIRIRKTGSKNDRLIAEKLLDQDQIQISKISEMSEILQVSNSSITRFARKMGYPSFKHFQYELSKGASEYKIESSKKDYSTIYAEKAKQIMKNVKNAPIYIISSKRGEPISFLMANRLQAVNIKVYMFHQSDDTLEEFIEKSKEGNLFVVSISGYSKIFSDAMSLISKKDDLHVLLITASKWMKAFERFNYVSLGEINDAFNTIKVDDSWENYNKLLIELSMILMNISSEIYRKKQESRIEQANKGRSL